MMDKTTKKKNKHILIVTQYFYPETIRINDIAKELSERCFKVTVLTGIPNYPEGKFFTGYDYHKKRKETWNNIEIIRIPIIPRGKSKLKLILNYYSFVLSGKKWASFTTIKPDIVFCFGTSPLFQATIAEKISKRFNIPFYLYVQDLWPEFLEAATGIKIRFLSNHYHKLFKRIYNHATTIFTTSPSFVDIIKNRTSAKVIYLPQYAEDFYKPVKRIYIPEIKGDGTFKIVFTGNIGAAQGLDILIGAALKLDDVKFIIIGNGRKKIDLISKLDNRVKNKFVFIDRKPAREIPKYLAACDVAFISFSKDDIFSKTIPAKLQSYMACGMPILAVTSGEVERIIEEANCGLCSKPGDIDALIKNILKLKKDNLKEKSDNAIKYSIKYFNKENIIDILCKEINSIIKNNYEKEKDMH